MKTRARISCADATGTGMTQILGVDHPAVVCCVSVFGIRLCRHLSSLRLLTLVDQYRLRNDQSRSGQLTICNLRAKPDLLSSVLIFSYYYQLDENISHYFLVVFGTSRSGHASTKMSRFVELIPGLPGVTGTNLPGSIRVSSCESNHRVGKGKGGAIAR